MTWLDLIILVVILLSAVVGAWRGLVKESVSLATWVLAIWIALRFSGALAGLLPESLSSVNFGIGELRFRVDNLRVGIAMVVLFVLTLVVGAVANFLLSRLVKVANFSGIDRALGGLFGVARGAVLVVGLVLLAGLSSVPRSSLWSDSLLVAPFEDGAQWVLGVLPDHISRYFAYS
jgi:membrane protein required for colicin V production